jgi:membrane protein implicated in regulation of membrane protease activity
MHYGIIMLESDLFSTSLERGMRMNLIIWLVIAAIMIVAEIISLGLTTIWFAGGAMVAALLAYLGAGWLVQIVVFAVVSLILLLFTRPIAQKHLMKDPEKTNVEALVGMTAYVTEAIDNVKAKGVVKLNGLEWSARSEDGSSIAEDEEVVVKAVSGVKLIVSKK